MNAKHLTVALLGFAVVLLLAAGALAGGGAVKIMNKDGIGPYIADANGMTLYYFAKDAPGKSACAGDCLTKWPPLAVDKVEVQAGLAAADFGTIKRDDGTAQVTFKGFPLYYFFKDKAAGDTNGQGVIDAWFVVDPAKFPPK